LRFAIAALPCLFVRKPGVSWPLLIAISFTLFLGQFLAQAFAIADGVPVGLSSVIVQSQALFTIGFAAILFAELPTRKQAIGIGCVIGLAGIYTRIAYWLWGRLLRDYPAAQVVPFALLVPFVGPAASSVVSGETFGPLRLACMVTVVGGIAVLLLSKRATSK